MQVKGYLLHRFIMNYTISLTQSFDSVFVVLNFIFTESGSRRTAKMLSLQIWKK